MAIDTDRGTLAGLDALENLGRAKTRRPVGANLWAATWPKLLAIGIFLLVWQSLIWAEWKDPWSLASPADAWAELTTRASTSEFWRGVYWTLRRAVVGFAIASVIGLVIGVAVARIKVLRAAIGSMITALQTMPSIAWFPLAILLFKVSETTILFVIILGAAPSIANGVIAGVDYVPPLWLRAGRNIGARGINLYRYVIAPASLPHIVSGFKQGWAFAWRSLMAGELLVIVPGAAAIGTQLQFAREFVDSAWVITIMIVIFVIGVVVDTAFSAVDRAVRRRWGMTDT